MRENHAAPTVVLDNAFEVIGHDVAQGAFVRQAEAVREDHSRVDDGAVQQLRKQRYGFKHTQTQTDTIRDKTVNVKMPVCLCMCVLP